MAKKGTPKTDPKQAEEKVEWDKTAERKKAISAKNTINPVHRHSSLASQVAGRMFSSEDKPDRIYEVRALLELTGLAADGEKKPISDILMSQAVTLDALFTEMAMRSVNNMGQYLDASEKYMRLALRAQSNSRSTLEALTKLHQPREQTVKHVHVNEGGQAVVADEFHQHKGGSANANPSEQSHTTQTTSRSAPMLGQDTQGDGVPITSGKGAAKV